MPVPSAKFVRIGPADARKLLKRNTHNRDVKGLVVEQYAADMRAGSWVLNGEAIKIGSNGQILDGQHRLLAVIEADAFIETLLVTGLEPDSQETMDSGLARSFSDVLQLRGEAQYTTLAAAVRTVCIYERDGLPILTGPSPSVLEQSRTLDRNPGIRDSVAAILPLRQPWLQIPRLAGLHYLLCAVDEEAALEFLTLLSTGERLDRETPGICAIYLLRERLIEDRYGEDRESRLTQPASMALVVKAWNAYREGAVVRRLQWGARDKGFPAISGLVAQDAAVPA